MPFLQAASIYKALKLNDVTCLLHAALREESCHWAYCKLLILLHPEEILKKDSNGDLPIHIVAASKEISDEHTFVCMHCFSRRNTLTCMDFSNGDVRYSCGDCFEFESQACKLFHVDPGTLCSGVVTF